MLENETQFQKFLIQSIGKVEPESHVVQIEDKERPGVPDISYCIRSKEGWIECKFKKPSKMFKVKASQWSWWRAAALPNRRVFVMALDTEIVYTLNTCDILHKSEGLRSWTNWVSLAHQRGYMFSIYDFQNEGTMIDTIIPILRGEV